MASNSLMASEGIQPCKTIKQAIYTLFELQNVSYRAASKSLYPTKLLQIHQQWLQMMLHSSRSPRRYIGKTLPFRRLWCLPSIFNPTIQSNFTFRRKYQIDKILTQSIPQIRPFRSVLVPSLYPLSSSSSGKLTSRKVTRSNHDLKLHEHDMSSRIGWMMEQKSEKDEGNVQRI